MTNGFADMKEVIEQYIGKALGQALQLMPLPMDKDLPMFYSSQYEFFSGTLSNVDCVFCVERDNMRTTPLNIRKRLAFIMDL